MSYEDDEENGFKIPVDSDLTEIEEDLLAEYVANHRNLPYNLKIERVTEKSVFCRNSWGNHMAYDFVDGEFVFHKE